MKITFDPVFVVHNHKKTARNKKRPQYLFSLQPRNLQLLEVLKELLEQDE